jgi:hypothetical protein
MFQEEIFGREFGRKANRTYLTDLTTSPRTFPICERIAAGFHNQNRLRIAPTSPQNQLLQVIDDYHQKASSYHFLKKGGRLA